MADRGQGAPLRLIQGLFAAGTMGGLTDAQLLERFLTRRDLAAEAAFEALVLRHGAMVGDVCRQVLRDAHDVQDAFQATFLVLALRGHSIRRRDSLASWLYGVARRVSSRAKTEAVRRRAREQRRAALTVEAYEPPADRPDLRVLYEELDRLPPRYREPVVLCDLEGLSHEQAAVRLGCAVSTVGVRLLRARGRLRERLNRRGFAVGAGTALAGLTVRGASAAMPQALVWATIEAALRCTGGRGAIAWAVSAPVQTLTRGVLRSMLHIKLKMAALTLLLAGVAGGVLGLRGPSVGAGRGDQGAAGQTQEVSRSVEKSAQPKVLADNSSDRYRMEGTVSVEGTGEPVEGAKIQVRVADSSKNHRGEVRAVTSGKDGRYVLELLPGHGHAWTLFPPAGYWAPNNPKNHIETFVLTPAEPVHRKDYVVRRGTVWTFHVTGGRDGKPIPGYLGAHLQGNSFLADVSDAGMGRLTLPTEGAKITVGATNRFTSRNGVQIPLEWQSGFRPDAINSLSRVEGTQDRFHVTDVAGKTATVQGSANAAPILEDGRLVIRAALPEPDPKSSGELNGQVSDAEGRPIEGARVALVLIEDQSSGISSEPHHRAVTDTQGRYRLHSIPRHLPAGKPVKLSVVVTKDGFASVDSPVFLFQPGADDSPQMAAPIRLEPGDSLRGRVVDPEGRPVEGVWVEPGGSYGLRSQFTRTDAQGRFTVRDLPKAQVYLYFRYGELWASGKYIGDGGADEIKIRLRRPPTDEEEVKTFQAKAAAAHPVAIGGQPAPEWQVGAWSDSKSRKLEDYRGQVVFLSFWGIWCSPCVKELPTIERLRRKYEPRGVVFVSIHTPGVEMKQIRKLLDLKKTALLSALDQDRKKDDNSLRGVTAERYGVEGYPTNILIDREGRVAFRSDGQNNLPTVQAIGREVGINDSKNVTEEQINESSERFLTQAIEKVLDRR